jgi:ribonuclease HI
MIILHTDGSCAPNPGPGGYAVICNGEPVALGFDTTSTNIRMEGQALIAALKIAQNEHVEIRTDSQFWISVITDWAIKWEANGWKKKGGEIQNLDLVKQLCALYKSSTAKLVFVRAHVGTEGNELADTWANKAREQFLEVHPT